MTSNGQPKYHCSVNCAGNSIDMSVAAFLIFSELYFIYHFVYHIINYYVLYRLGALTCQGLLSWYFLGCWRNSVGWCPIPLLGGIWSSIQDIRGRAQFVERTTCIYVHFKCCFLLFFSWHCPFLSSVLLWQIMQNVLCKMYLIPIIRNTLWSTVSEIVCNCRLGQIGYGAHRKLHFFSSGNQRCNIFLWPILLIQKSPKQ